MIERVVQAELLDELPHDDPGAVGSRRDLRRINAGMGNAAKVARALNEAFPREPPRRIFDLGAGDGSLLLGVARRMECSRRPALRSFGNSGSNSDMSPPTLSPATAASKRPSTAAVLVDRQARLQPEIRRRLEAMNWTVQAVVADVFHFCENGVGMADAIIANLFLHHFTDVQLRQLFRLVSAKTRVFVSVEPRRSRPASYASRLLLLMGCNSVTRHDAVVSVKAGFAGRELASLWPAEGGWELSEGRAGLFGHLFVARRLT